MSEQTNMAAHYEHEIPEGYEARIEGNKVIIELKESEDERIRKRLIEEMKHFQRKAAKESYDADFEFAKSAIAWLERHKEHNPNSIAKHVYSKDDENFIRYCSNILRNHDYEESAKRLLSMITQQSAEWSKDDIRIINNLDSVVFYDKKLPEETAIELRKWLDNIRNRILPSLSIQPKVEWSEEDKRMLEWAIACCQKTIGQLPQAAANWLKSLRPQPKQEWSEEDNEALNMCVDAIPKAWKTKSGKLLTDWFLARITYIKLNNWKPSEEQMNSLNSIILYGSFTYVGQVQDLISLKDDLKKLT